MSKKIVSIGVLVIILMSILGLSGCRTSYYTEEEHVQRITKRIRKRFIDGDEMLAAYEIDGDDYIKNGLIKATGFTVYPIYDENDELRYFLVEFQPYGFRYVYLRDDKRNWWWTDPHMYMISTGGSEWTHRKVDQIGGSTYKVTGSEAGDLNKNRYINSPFFVRGIENERRYLLALTSATFVPAVKRDGVFINIISNTEIDYKKGQELEKPESVVHIAFPINANFIL